MKIVKNINNTILKDRPEVSDKEAEEAFKTILRWIGENPDREGLIDTPRRVTKAFKEYFKNLWRCKWLRRYGIAKKYFCTKPLRTPYGSNNRCCSCCLLTK